MAKTNINTTNGSGKSKTYGCWRNMISRCYDSSDRGFHNYGGRGIVVCEEWFAFSSFYEDMGDQPSDMTIERINNDGDYTPHNCRWATRREQSVNTRRNVFIEYDGRTMTLSQWALDTSIPYSTLYRRIKTLGWEVGLALSLPVSHANRTQGVSQ